ncbi:MAG: imelysin family protein, partial [Spongiibacteraceae bacterium]
GLIDYTDDDYEYALGNIAATFNIVNNPLINLGGDTLDTQQLDPDTLKQLHELGGSEANVATGYHAIEFLLWGQDLHGSMLGAGERPYTDYVVGDGCSHGNCQRRGEYLLAASQLLVADLRYMVEQWAGGQKDNYRAELAKLPSNKGIARIFYGMGSLSLGELGGERIKVSLEANSTEDEHDCFSDNTHWSHYYNGLGIQNIYLGRYQKLDGSLLQGPSIHQLLTAKSANIASATASALQHSMTTLTALSERAESPTEPMKFDMMIAEGNSEGAAILEAILRALVTQTRALETAAKTLSIDPNAMRD